MCVLIYIIYTLYNIKYMYAYIYIYNVKYVYIYICKHPKTEPAISARTKPSVELHINTKKSIASIKQQKNNKYMNITMHTSG